MLRAQILAVNGAGRGDAKALRASLRNCGTSPVELEIRNVPYQPKEARVRQAKLKAAAVVLGKPPGTQQGPSSSS